MVSEFDADTALVAAGDGVFRGEISDRWMIGGGPNGGYVAAFLIRAMAQVSPQPDPLTMTTHYAGRPELGACEVAATITSAGRAHAFLSATMTQAGSVRATAVAIFGRRRDDQLEDNLRTSPATGTPGEGVPRDTPPHLDAPMASFLERFEYRDPTGVDMFAAAPNEPARVGGWTRLVDRDLDSLAVPLFCDCWPPPMFRRHGSALSPTIELTVHFRHAPEPGWNWCQFESRTLSGGYVEEDGEVWSESGTLIAQSRQLARFTLMPPPAP
ncbi:MAG: hypothetical protein QOI61_1969 [Actinomycetota bacterium]|jgi:hypothetical protein